MEACLEKYPEHRETLAPLLAIAHSLQDHQAPAAPSPYFLVELKSKLTIEANNTRKGGEADSKSR